VAEFFSDVAQSDVKSDQQRRALDETRRLLTHLNPRFVGTTKAWARR
jgi:hypothetical protein